MRLVGCGQRDAEELSCDRHRHRLEAMASHHLVARLQKIAWIEEATAAKQWIDDGLRVAIERAGRRESCKLGIW